MSHNSDDFTAVVAILVIFGLPLGYAISNRYFAHQERMAMIQRGITPPPPDPHWSRRAAAQAWAQPPYPEQDWQAQRALRKGVSVAMIGFALLVGLSFIDPFRPGPWLLGGLIPLFVGLAQIVTALMSGARLGFGAYPPGPGISQQPGPQQYEEPSYGATRNVPPGPYAWRPGSTTELERPVRPPDVK